ncbi:diguanylate cyclase (GGDEF) domain-containing protein [Actinoplanes philippinensis]|uniref:Diguanylate cyclase (GGDEF) domain-containing protein n=1 Tax=Actinoplanes philippinensis TaxID=35752 RepID=A0A1I2MKH1_9ACTN|nr:bifunctional diguanylate cyclase/phosphodiesterase [Actinoplanes philippinensis]SFF91942.1 diguanylate cyclase (GGDEF) domain-containing protein [Actinoplanes philippinensis]
MASTTPLLRWRSWYVPFAVLMAVADVLLIVLGTRTGFHRLVVWVPAVCGVATAVASFAATARDADGPLAAFWRRVAVAMGAVLAGAVSHTVDVALIPFDGMPPLGARTLLCYVVGTLLAIVALLRLPGGGRSWRQLTTALLDLAVVAVTAGVAASEYLGWAVGRFGGQASAWWLNLAMVAIGVAGVTVVVKIMSASRSPAARAALWWLSPIGIAGPLSMILMTVLLPWPHLNGSAVVLPFVGLFGTLAAYAQQRVLTGHGASSARVAHPAVYRRGAAIPLFATGMTSLLVGVVYLRTGHLTTIQVGGTTLLLLLVVARQALALAENATLLETVAHQAMHDELTGLYGRRSFAASVAGAEGPHTVVLIDLKDFRSINDSLGAGAGDALLTGYARRLTAIAGEQAVVARLGGDEFGLLLPGAPDATAGTVARLVAAGDEPLSAAGHEVVVEVSIGIADDTDLYRRAEIALREAAGHADARVVRYDASLERQINQRATIAADLRRGLHTGEFHMVYQPIVALPHGLITGVESLIRWTRADGRTISPADFVPVAEETGLIVELGEWIVDAVCAQAADWHRRYGPDVLGSVGVNVSARQLLDPGLPDMVASALARHGLPAQHLTVEITETAVFGGGRALASVQALSDLGVRIALDDFGTGHSSLGLLRTCPVDVIKVDKSFVDGLNGTPQQEAIAGAIADIAEKMELSTVAEGVERPEQARRLFELGYRRAQGFLFARPMSAAGIDALLDPGVGVAA